MIGVAGANDQTRPVRTVLLLQNSAEFPSLSMKRYAESLRAALDGPGGAGWGVHMPEVCGPAALAWVAGRANASRWCRLVRYPQLVRRWRRNLWPDVCHVLDHSHANLLAACDPASSVATVHDVIPMLAAVGELDVPYPAAVRHTFPRKLRRIARCRRVIADSESTKRHLLRFTDLRADRVEVVYLGVGTAFAPPVDGESRRHEREAILARHGVDPARPVVLHVCTRNRYKNSPALLQALARLPAEVVLLRVGAALFDDERELADRLGVAGRVVDAGRVPGQGNAGDAALAAYYRAADAFAFPSTFEGFGWPPLEAMACGTPVALSTAASLPEVGGDAALYADPHDHDALAAALGRLLSDPAERDRRATAGLARAATFTWDRCARGTAAVYDAVASNA